MSDRELLELAAKAAGFNVHELRDGYLYVYVPSLLQPEHEAIAMWSPLDDDGDNRLLANKLELSIVFAEENDCCWVTVFGAPYAWYDQIDAVQEAYPVSRVGQDAAVRRAVVRAAADIGRNMP